jgi:alkanesulfonate monooxygenase SsuD/methylene tetrahydromethanopterin reductase-like flavin-dependent oxidoreductase (luciferase family)
MKLGAASFMAEGTMSPAELARELEAHDFESMWIGDHSHIAVRADGGPLLDTRTGKPLPTEYAGLFDPFVALGYAAAVTSTIRLGTSVCLINERDPITTAKQVATLDYLSNGRFEFGIGAGWHEPAMRDHGTEPAGVLHQVLPVPGRIKRCQQGRITRLSSRTRPSGSCLRRSSRMSHASTRAIGLRRSCR